MDVDVDDMDVYIGKNRTHATSHMTATHASVND
jgi:hypothetical protein